MFAIKQADGDGGLVTVAVTGDIDLASADKLGEALATALVGAREVRIDMSEVTFLDSTGVRALLVAHRAAANLDARLYVTGAKQWVARVLELTGVGPLLAE